MSRHHYIPVFYLKRWAAPDGRIVEFSRPFGTRVRPRRTAPAGTGYVDNLYEARGLPADHRQYFETEFLSPVDNAAADALAILESGRDTWNVRTRSAWSRFILSLLIRAPLEIDAIKANFRNMLLLHQEPTLDERYLAIRRPTDPATLQEFVASQDDLSIEFHALSFFARLHNMVQAGQTLNNMQWYVLPTEDGQRLLTSDAPVEMGGLRQENAVVALPIGPNRLFIAVHVYERYLALANFDRKELVRRVNQQTLERATKYAFGKDDSSLSFVQRHLSKSPRTSMFMRTFDRVVAEQAQQGNANPRELSQITP